mmetsp:Transcript_15599/g.48834  ORF Transcript_15599/g.48834 Transcript_15599/m.48834 type:complete len:355 (-) Transcript_15599:31-1095(-)
MLGLQGAEVWVVHAGQRHLRRRVASIALSLLAPRPRRLLGSVRTPVELRHDADTNTSVEVRPEDVGTDVVLLHKMGSAALPHGLPCRVLQDLDGVARAHVRGKGRGPPKCQACVDEVGIQRAFPLQHWVVCLVIQGDPARRKAPLRTQRVVPSEVDAEPERPLAWLDAAVQHRTLRRNSCPDTARPVAQHHLRAAHYTEVRRARPMGVPGAARSPGALRRGIWPIGRNIGGAGQPGSLCRPPPSSSQLLNQPRVPVPLGKLWQCHAIWSHSPGVRAASKQHVNHFALTAANRPRYRQVPAWAALTCVCSGSEQQLHDLGAPTLYGIVQRQQLGTVCSHGAGIRIPHKQKLHHMR